MRARTIAAALSAALLPGALGTAFAQTTVATPDAPPASAASAAPAASPPPPGADQIQFAAR
ncbi:MAG TPA: galactose-1-epimerase, partial [Polyangiaceae bacterium]|nr:galactose-1-epimerase [Polyangiaceae bacterium]